MAYGHNACSCDALKCTNIKFNYLVVFHLFNISIKLINLLMETLLHLPVVWPLVVWAVVGPSVIWAVVGPEVVWAVVEEHKAKKKKNLCNTSIFYNYVELFILLLKFKLNEFWKLVGRNLWYKMNLLLVFV